MSRQLAFAWMLGLTLLLPAAAQAQTAVYAQTAYTNRSVNMRAGPNQEFPLVTWVGAGVPVIVNGCIEGYTWCDVTAGQERGWIAGDYLSYPYQNQPVTVVSAGPVLGFPLVSFAIGPYWDNYYRYRPWYGNKSYWYGRPNNWWYRPPPPRPYQPVVRPWPGHYGGGGNWNNNYNNNYNNYHNSNRPPNYNNSNRGNNNNWNNNNNNNNNNNARPQAARPPNNAGPGGGNRPPQQAQSKPAAPRAERPVTGEMDRSSKSQRTYTQQ